MNCVFCKRPETEIVAENDLAWPFAITGDCLKITSTVGLLS